MRYYLVAGERSGDMHGGNLIKALKSQDPTAEFRGWGGDRMQEAGMTLVTHYREMAFMGFVEVLLKFREVYRFIRQCKEDIHSTKPDVVILIDYAGFNLRIAKFVNQLSIPVFYYISPKVWAWQKKRAFTLKARVDEMFVILPFEEDFYKGIDWQVHYVGNPVMDAVQQHEPLSLNTLPADKNIVALLPGSRIQELKNVLPIMEQVVQAKPEYHFVLAGLTGYEKHYRSFEGQDNVSIVYDQAYDVLGHAGAAIVTSGTATLETCLWKVPQVVIYKTSNISYQIIKRMIRVPFISLVNLIAGREVVKELIQNDCKSEIVSQQLMRLIEDKNYKNSLLQDYDKIYKLLGTASASDRAAKAINQQLKKYIS